MASIIWGHGICPLAIYTQSLFFDQKSSQLVPLSSSIASLHSWLNAKVDLSSIFYSSRSSSSIHTKKYESNLGRNL